MNRPRIISPGVVLKENLTPLPEIECTHCGCIFTYDPKTKYITGTGNQEWYAVKCPMKGCNRSVAVSEMF